MGTDITSQNQQGRLPALDVLRAVAIALVLVRHQPLPRRFPAFGFPPLYRLQLGGWTGVDLFFVLSGFLIAGLLFREHRRYGAVHLGRFYLRRGLKIYPAFYVFLLTTLPLQFHWNPRAADVRAAFRNEALFIQNYRYSLWDHTWSLAIEEHFYIALPVFLLLLGMLYRRRPDPFKAVPVVFAVVAGLLLWARHQYQRTIADLSYCTLSTHLRIDSLFFGVTLAYFFHYHHDAFIAFCRRAWPLLAVAGVALLAPAFFSVREKSRFVFTTGFTLFYLGSGMILCAAVSFPWKPARFGRSIAYVGSHSYSIYLWHIIVQKAVVHDWVSGVARWPWLASTFAYYAVSIGLGVAMSNLTEYPVLRLRDRYFPSRVSHVLSPTESRRFPVLNTNAKTLAASSCGRE